ncbi:MAG: hypothetical protein IKY98_00120 [Alphaproteobacteria bacterium]|nr:hypothetical protein [Alphaproteobacteria bacterium]
MWHPERQELWVEYQGRILNLFDCDGQKFDWQGNLDLSFLDLKTEEMPDLSKMVVHGDLNVSYNELTGFKKLPRVIYGSLYASFNKIETFDDFPDLVARECVMLGNRYHGTKRIEDGSLGSPDVITQDYYIAWREEQTRRLMSVCSDMDKMMAIQRQIFDEDAFRQAQDMLQLRQKYLWRFSDKLKDKKNEITVELDDPYSAAVDEYALTEPDEAQIIGVVVAVEEEVLPRTVVRAWERHRKKKARKYPYGRRKENKTLTRE